ncbi:MAG: hypothetical protein IKO72_14015 [Kiritimatiellae bacterium]|nr:hypothetical protein [Kiritimatiellia bacterium]
MKKTIDNDIDFRPAGMDYVNPRAKVVIVGITPGNSQTKKPRDGKSKKEIKRENAFMGGMRNRLVKMLDAIGVNKFLDIKTCDTLWSDDFDKVQMTSLLRDATSYRGKMYNGKPSILDTPMLRMALMDGFVKHDCRKCSAAELYVALGPTVEKVLAWLKAEGKLTAPIVTIPHASGLNRERVAVFLKERTPKATDISELRAVEMRRIAKKTLSKLLASRKE